MVLIVLPQTSLVYGPELVSTGVVSMHLQVLKEVTGKPTLYYREGGTIPAMALIKKELGIDMTMFAFGLPDDRIHAPNERYAQPLVCTCQYVAAVGGSRRHLTLMKWVPCIAKQPGGLYTPQTFIASRCRAFSRMILPVFTSAALARKLYPCAFFCV